MKITRPKIPPQPEETSLDVLTNDVQLEDSRLHDVDATKLPLGGLDLTAVVFEKVNFTGSHCSRATLRDVIAKQSDFSSTIFDNGSLVRVEFVSCRMTGVDFSESNVHDVVFRGCKVDLANFRRADLRRVQFIDCTLVEADFNNASLTSVEFKTSILDATSFVQSRAKLVDLRTSQLLAIKGWGSLSGTMIDNVQLINSAAYLARELGIIVRD